MVGRIFPRSAPYYLLAVACALALLAFAWGAVGVDRRGKAQKTAARGHFTVTHRHYRCVEIARRDAPEGSKKRRAGGTPGAFF